MNVKRLFKQQNGYTLTEVVVVMSIISIVTLLAMNFTINNIAEYAVAHNRANLMSQAQLALDRINNDIRLSAGADENNRWPDPHNPAGSSNLFGWESNNNTLVLASAVEDTAGEIIFADPSNYISEKNNLIYFIDNNTLYKRSLAAPVDDNSVTTTCPEQISDDETCPADDRLFLTNVQQFIVTYINSQGESVEPSEARAIELYIELTDSVYGRTIEANYSTRMVFRND